MNMLDVYKKYKGKRVRIVADNDRVFIGDLYDYIYADDNDNGKDAVVIDPGGPNTIVFFDGDIKEIDMA